MGGLMRLSDLQSKDIIGMNDGKKIGSIIDVVVTSDGLIECLIVECGRFFSRFSHSELEIKWSDIKKIGEDVILVSI